MRDLGVGLQLVGIAIQVVGVGFSVYGFWRTWHEFASPGENLRDWLTIPMRRASQRLERSRFIAWVHRLLGRPIQHPVGAGVAIGGGGALRARGRMQYPPIDVSDLTAAVAELDRRVREQVDRLSDVRDRMDDADETTAAAFRTISDQLGHEVAALQSRDRRVAIGGIRPAMFGLALTAIGLLLIGSGLAWAG